ncbi:hypothetical protein J437_LFUL006414 [Ladona fulva]|uniref:Uncharacterized protein n=1 Tax=Ladona fulva TaxID=123851 RepID=A0A8K0NX68_LADFU|nr:hypothetical protein J437_LFUL006414 [Ladona fulva]
MIRKILFENVCRLCGQEKQNGVNVLNGPRGNELLSKINSRLSKEIVHFYPEDGLPKFVCSDCEVVINSFSEFCSMVQLVQQKLEVISNSCSETSQTLEQRNIGCTASLSISDGGCITCLLCTTSLGNNVECATLHSVGHGIALPIFICRLCGCSGEGLNNLIQPVSDGNWNRCRACNSLISPNQRNGTDALKSVQHIHQNGMQNDVSLNAPGQEHPNRNFSPPSKNAKSQKRKKSKSMIKGKDNSSNHLGASETTKSFTCEVCARTFASRAHLIRHRLVHSGARPFRCDSCPAAFSQRGSLQIHSLQHSGTAPYPCPHCPRAFRFKVSLRSHILNIHPGESVNTETINQSYASSDTNVGVMTMASVDPGGKGNEEDSILPGRGNRPSSDHRCDRCGKRFATAYKLGRHYRSHTGERPFECRDCGKRFSQTGNLNLHRKMHHSQQSLREEGEAIGDEAGSRNEGMEQDRGCAETSYDASTPQVGRIESFAEMESSLGFGNMGVDKGILGDGREAANECILGDFEEGIAQSMLAETTSNVVRHHADLSLIPSPLSCATPTISAMDKVLSGQSLSQIMEGEGLVDKVFSKLGSQGEGSVVYHSEGLIAEEEGFPGMGSLGGRQFGEYVGNVGGNEEGGGLLFLVEEEGLGTPMPIFPSLQTPPPPPLPHT